MAYLAKNNTDLDSNESLKSEFIGLAKRFSELAKIAGCEIYPFVTDEVPYFTQLSLPKKQEALNALKVFIKICNSTLEHGKPLSDTKSLTWFACLELNLRFKSDVFDKIENSDLVEIYNTENVQIFRNFKFLELVSYTVEDIFCRPWTELFYRPEAEKGLIVVETLNLFYSKKSLKTVSLSHMGTHIIEEADSAFRNKFSAVIKHLSPVFDRTTKEPCGAIAIESAKLISEPLKNVEREKKLEEYYKRQHPELFN